ncbi:hypothetical protein Mal4_16300 [Maioricimonas rarisocia]|uniref:Sulfatase n=1 Tax=Maioricimonas rarisocia TaxID=2528026 RepID=A0A517Z4A9_9PLAN|nr:DUF1501 domain-containing protein [Maioricimonas rarisocia]QDU37320.1 hypothetical protein Mal4_16300 [Maioricimonas rarisocia]
MPEHSLRPVPDISRREWLRLGGIGLGGLTLADLLASTSHAGTGTGGNGRAKSVIMVCLLGGPGQHETWDPKPHAPEEVRGEFGTIPSAVPGINVGELMPLTAAHTDKTAIFRAVVTDDNAHSSSGYQMLTGVPHVPMNQENATPKFPNRHPNIGGVVRHLQPTVNGIPSAVQLPLHIFNDGMITWPGQDAGWLGRQADPWLLECDPSADDFHIPDLQLQEGLAATRMQKRRALRSQISATFEELNASRRLDDFDDQTRLAYGLLTSPESQKAFAVSDEPPARRDRYGRTRFGQSLLLARRLVEAGVRLVQVNWTRLPGKPNNGTWDTHGVHAKSMKEWLMPIMDQAYSALLEDLSERGLLDETLVFWMGEFGRTPRVNRRAGRDHWGRCFSVALAGGGVKGGQVIGASDAQAAYPESGLVRPHDLTATLFHTLGFAPGTEVHDTLGRPLPISRGHVISELF